MPFTLQKIPINNQKNQKIQAFFMSQLGYSSGKTQKIITKGRVFDTNGIPYTMSQNIQGNFIQIAVFQGQTRGLKPIFKTDEFAIFDKPSGLIVHPSSRNTEYCLLDEVRYHLGDNANLAHRLDSETSGIIMASSSKLADILLKNMFEAKQYQKTYYAHVYGQVTDSLSIDSPISKDLNSSIGIKMKVDSTMGKESLTKIKPLVYNKKKNQTLLEVKPITGRQHQIRVHLDSIGHTIIGDPIYGVDEAIADKYLCKTLSIEERIQATKGSRLMLHAFSLEFYFKGVTYKIVSKQKFHN